MFRSIGNPLYLPWCLEGLAAVAAVEGRFAHAARLCGKRDALRARPGIGLPPADPPAYARLLESVRAALGQEAFDREQAAGRELPPE